MVDSTDVAVDSTPVAAAPRPVAAGLPRGRWAPRVFVTPAVLIVIVLGLYPLAFLIAAALTHSTLGQPLQGWVGARNLRTALGDGDVTASLARTAGYALAVSATSIVTGTAVAVALDRAVRSGHLIRTLLLLPLMTPPVTVAVLWKVIFSPEGGLLNTVLRSLGHTGAPVSLLSSSMWAPLAVGLADVWQWTPLVVLIVFAALVGVPREVLEAAAIDGAGAWRAFLHITLPLLAPTLASVFLIRLVIAFKVFDLVVVLTSGGPGQATTTTSYLIYLNALQEFDVGRAAAITLLLAVLVTVVTLPVTLLARRLHR